MDELMLAAYESGFGSAVGLEDDRPTRRERRQPIKVVSSTDLMMGTNKKGRHVKARGEGKRRRAA